VVLVVMGIVHEDEDEAERVIEKESETMNQLAERCAAKDQSVECGVQWAGTTTWNA
jgi:hypothetical protein